MGDLGVTLPFKLHQDYMGNTSNIADMDGSLTLLIIDK